MKQILGLLAMAAILLMTTTVTAQQGARQGADRENWQEREITAMKQEFNLDADQEKKIRSIMAERQKEMQARRQQAGNQTMDREQRMEEARKQRESFNNKVKEVLNEEQKKKYDAWQKKRREEIRRERGQGQGPGGNR